MPLSPGGASRGFLEALEELRDRHFAELSTLRLENVQLRAKVSSLEAQARANSEDIKEIKALGSPHSLEEAKVLTLDPLPTEHIQSDAREEPPQQGLELGSLRKAQRTLTGALYRLATPRDEVLPFEPVEVAPKKPTKTALEFVEQLVHRPWFELLFGALIFLNALVMAAEAQHSGLVLGTRIDHKSVSHLKGDTVWHNADQVFVVLGWFFGIAFLLELVLKVLGLRLQFPYSTWNWIDLAIVVLWIVGVVGASLPMDPNIIRLARLARLVRLLRLAQTIRGFDKLHLISSALSSSISILAWTCVLFFIIQMVISLFLGSLLTELYLSNADQPLDNRRTVFTYFGTFSRAMFSVFEITLGNWPPISRELAENVSEWFMLFGVLHKLTLGFAFVGVVNGIFMQETFKVAATNDAIMVRNRQRMVNTHAKKMKMFFKQADTSGDGNIDRGEFKKMLSNPSVSTWLASMDLDETDHDLLFSLIDDGDGALTLPELVKGVARLRGSARSIDLVQVKRQLEEIKITLEAAGLGFRTCLS